MISTDLITRDDVKAWVGQEITNANNMAAEKGVTGFMEVVAYPSSANREVSIPDLKTSLQNSQIHTFGWPIGVIIDNGEIGPRVMRYGIHFEVDLEERNDEVDGRVLDYWSATKNGTFYMLQSLFEDTRKSGEIFFDTRVVRATELFMYLTNLYRQLGYSEETEIKIAILYSGIKDRHLTKASPTRILFGGRKAFDNPNPIVINATISELDHNMDDYVDMATKELFELFDVFQLDRKVLSDIVSNYRVGKIT